MRASIIASSLLLAGLLACGGGASAPGASTLGPATGLAYADPAGTGWRLVRDPASTPQRLLLNLVGPSGLRGRGVGFVLQGGPGFAWGRLEGALVQDLGVFEYTLDPAGPYPGEPTLFLAGTQGHALQVSAYQKSPALAAKAVDQPLLRVALTFKGDAGPRAGEVLPLAAPKAFLLPEYLTTGALEPIQIAVGTLSTR